MKKKVLLMPLIIYFLASSFYLYEFALQVAPSVMVNQLMSSMQTDSLGLSWLAAAYYYAYAPMQIPAGILFDRFGPRKLISIAILLCVLGTFLFSSANTLWIAALGRFLIGIGSAFSFVGILVLIANWFEDKYFALLVGIAQLLSSVGVICGQYLLADFIEQFGWRGASIRIALLGLILVALTWLVIRDKPSQSEMDESASEKMLSFKELILSFMTICKMKQTWFIALYAFVIWGPMTFFSSLWAIQYLIVSYDFSTQEAIRYEMLLWIGVAIACPLFGGLSNLMKRRVLPMTICALFGLFASLIMINTEHLPISMMSILLLIIGMSAAGQTVSFGLVRDIQPKKYLGSASGFNNMATVAGGAILQPIIGFLMKYYWDGQTAHGVPIYTLATYQKALVLLPACYGAALFLTLFCIKESYCQSIELKYKDVNDELKRPTI